MWYPCNCRDCDSLENASWLDSQMGSFPIMHGLLSLPVGQMGTGVGYQAQPMALQKSATCGCLPSYLSSWKDEIFDQQHLINGRLAITDGRVKDARDEDDILEVKLRIGSTAGVGSSAQSPQEATEEGVKKSRDYSDDSLTPDSSLPAVIRRRNRNRRKKLATSLAEPTPCGSPWVGEHNKPPPRTRSHSVSDDQWSQMMAAQTNTTPTTTDTQGTPSSPTCPPGHVPADMSAFAGAPTRRGYNSISSSGRSGNTLGRGMVSSASVCDLNSLAQQQASHAFSTANPAGSFQQLNMMGYGGGMLWGAPCELCQAQPMFTTHPGMSGMKRTASNLSMNLSSVGSDMSGYPWAPPPPHIHHHMPMYPGYYPGYHPHMPPPPMGTPMGLNMSIPDSMHTFGKVTSSPAPSVRSTSHRSHKSSKSRSFSAADTSGRRSRNRKAKRSEESEDSRSSSGSDEEDDIDDNKSGHGGVSSLAWQCDHCTFINSGGARTCGMCSKTVGSSSRTSRRNSERRRSDRRRDRRTDQEDNERDLSDYDNDGGGIVKSNFSFNVKESKRENRKVSGTNKSKSKKKSRRRDGSESQSESGSEGEEELQLERNMRDLKVSSSSRRRGSDHDGTNNKDRERERTSRKKEGKLRWKD
ncbi:hypothetical protein OTU49_012044 [Cherax quadricarinatus]|uniref:RanBP2-type domain-containing protein n=1 Tax=Cherax quadricarinatus TaxID=27406 RepID=A0AAW0W0J4_CHEQU